MTDRITRILTLLRDDAIVALASEAIHLLFRVEYLESQLEYINMAKATASHLATQGCPPATASAIEAFGIDNRGLNNIQTLGSINWSALLSFLTLAGSHAPAFIAALSGGWAALFAFFAEHTELLAAFVAIFAGSQPAPSPVVTP